MPEKLCWNFRVPPSFVLKIFIHTSYFMASVVLLFLSVMKGLKKTFKIFTLKWIPFPELETKNSV